MTSQVNPNNIDGTYPVAGQDNDSQGFRDNFTNIRNNFTYMKAEVEDLQNKAVLKTNLNNTTLSNDFFGNAIVNASLTSWRETYKDVGLTDGSTTISFSNGNYQKIRLNSATTVNFSFPSNVSGQVASIKLWVNFPSADPARTLTFGTIPTLGDPDTIAGYNAGVITFNAAELANNTDYLFEIWTVDAGTTLGVSDLIRSRDIQLSGDIIAGGLTSNGISILGSGSSNVVVAATSTSPSGSTTQGALVVKGGAAIVGNVNIGANLITQGGRINQNYAYVTLTNDRNYFANIQHQTIFFDTASSATIANARIALPSAAIDGREINMSFLAPITALWVNNGNTAAVKWLPNTAVSSGNVHIKFIYSVGQSTWIRSA